MLLYCSGTFGAPGHHVCMYIFFVFCKWRTHTRGCRVGHPRSPRLRFATATTERSHSGCRFRFAGHLNLSILFLLPRYPLTHSRTHIRIQKLCATSALHRHLQTHHLLLQTATRSRYQYFAPKFLEAAERKGINPRAARTLILPCVKTYIK